MSADDFPVRVILDVQGVLRGSVRSLVTMANPTIEPSPPWGVEDGVGPEFAAALLAPPAFGLETAVLACRRKGLLRQTEPSVLLGKKREIVLTDDLVRGVALHPLGAGFPAADRSVAGGGRLSVTLCTKRSNGYEIVGTAGFSSSLRVLRRGWIGPWPR
jgi:hypothetical protein